MEHVLYFIKRLYALAGKKLIISVIGMVLISIIEGTGIVLLLPMISISGISNVNTEIPVISQILRFLQAFPPSLGLPFILGMYVVLVTGQNLLQRSLTIHDTVIQQSFLRSLRLETYSALLQSNWNFFVKQRKSDLINLLLSELTRVGFGTNLVLQLIASVIFTCIQVGIAFWLNPQMTFFVLFFGFLLTLFSRKFIKKSKALGNQTSYISKSFLAGTTDQLNGIKDIKSNTLEESRMVWFRSMTEKMMNEQIDYIKLRSSSQLFYKIASAVLIAVFVYFSIKIFHTKLEHLFLIFVIFSRLWPRFTGIQSNMENISAAIPAFKALIQLQEECKAAREFQLGDGQDFKAIEPFEVHQAIECRHVFYRYNRNEPIYALYDIQLHIPSRQTTAIVGRSGAGKSTLIDILMGLMRPEIGEVLIDGVPLTSDKVRSLRQAISYVPQDPFLYNESIRDNLLMTAPDASEEQIWEALQFAAADDFVSKLPQGLDTLIGDRGIRLSGGERQRLVLTRAILRRPSVLVLDEATSALDSENELKIQEALERLKGTMTIIVIAHRLSTIRNADQVVVLEDGKVIQAGGYAELAKEKGGLFSHLLDIQIPNTVVV